MAADSHAWGIQLLALLLLLASQVVCLVAVDLSCQHTHAQVLLVVGQCFNQVCVQHILCCVGVVVLTAFAATQFAGSLLMQQQSLGLHAG